jgi:protease IV
VKGKGFWILTGSLLLLGLSAVCLLFAVMIFLGEGEMGLEAHGDLAVVEISGPILSSKEIVEQLNRVEKNDDIKGLILRIDSPGGGVGASQEIYQAVQRIKKSKKVVATMGGVAASGGYYIAVAADKIVANPGTITGSIGVLMDYTNVQQLLDFLKVHAEIITAGKMKDVGSPFKPLSEEDRKFLEAILQNMHQQFKKAVQEGRNLDEAKINELADGRIFTGQQALEAGLVDQLGNQEDAVDLACQLLGIKGKPKLLYPKKKKVDFFDLITQGDYDSKILQTIYSLSEKRALYMPKRIF